MITLAFGLAIALSACTAEPPDCPEGFEEDGLGNCLGELGGTQGLLLFEGDLDLDSSEDMAEFCSSYNAVSGNLNLVAAESIGSLEELDCLLAVGGQLNINELASMETAELTSLVQVGGDFYIQGNDSLSEIRLPLLERVGGAMGIQYNFELRELDAPVLQSVQSLVHVYKTGLQQLHLPSLRSVGDPAWLDWVPGEPVDFNDDLLYIRVNPDLEEIDLPQLEWVAGILKISSNSSMTSVQMPSLQRLGAGLYVSFSESCREVSLPIEEIGGFLYLQNTWLTSFSLPDLTQVGTNLAVNHNQLLETLDLPQLSQVGGVFDVRDNPQLPGSLVDELIEAIGEENIGGPIHTSGNGAGR